MWDPFKQEAQGRVKNMNQKEWQYVQIWQILKHEHFITHKIMNLSHWQSKKKVSVCMKTVYTQGNDQGKQLEA